MTKKKKIDIKKIQKWIQNNINPDVYHGTYTGFDPLGQSFELKSIDINQAGGVSSEKTSKKKKPVVETSPDGKTIIIKL